MTITTTDGEAFSRNEHRALARLMFKRFGRDKPAFCAAWRRMLQNNAEDHQILQLVGFDPRHDQETLRGVLLRNGYADAKHIQVNLLDETSCRILHRRILHRLICKVKQDGEQAGQRNIGRAIARGYVHP